MQPASTLNTFYSARFFFTFFRVYFQNVDGNADCRCSAEDRRLPSFSGSSYILLRSVGHVTRDVSIEMRFRPLRGDGLLLYTAQYEDGRGDFLSLALRRQYVEFRCVLSTGSAEKTSGFITNQNNKN